MLSEGFDIFTLKLNPIMLFLTKEGTISDIGKYIFFVSKAASLRK